MHSKFVLSAGDLDAILAGCRAKAAELGIGASIAIVDDGGHIFRVERGEGTGVLTPTVALAKARTAALMRAPSGALTARLKDEPELLRLTDYLPMPGGLPVRYEGACIGGVGISGGNAEQDVAIATAGLAAIG